MSTEQQLKPDNSDRFLGVFALIGSGVIGYICIVAPLIAASRHECSVSLNLKGVVVVPVIFTLGIINVIMGTRARPIVGRRQMPSPLGWVIYAVTFGLGILLYQWMKAKLATYGYVF